MRVKVQGPAAATSRRLSLSWPGNDAAGQRARGRARAEASDGGWPLLRLLFFISSCSLVVPHAAPECRPLCDPEIPALFSSSVDDDRICEARGTAFDRPSTAEQSRATPLTAVRRSSPS